ncbi:MAG: HD domain-containing protein [Myxococcales bacterium]|nr:HD domain-containing protein [Myxococcales bacterium]
MTFPDVASLHAFVHADPALVAVDAELRRRLAADPHGDDPGHDAAHAYRVALWTVRLAPDENPRHAIAAALLHDVVNVPKSSPDRHLASERSADVARALLPTLDFAPDDVARIAAAIRDHSFSRGAIPESPLGDALQDADRLEALGALGLCRTISTGSRMGARYFENDDPWGSQRELDDRRYSVDHFFTKLLGLAPTMRTAAGRAEGERRAAFLRAFLVQLGDEIGSPAPDRAR